MNHNKHKHPQEQYTTRADMKCGTPQANNELAAVQMKAHIRKLQRELFCLWSYIGQEGLWNEAKEYLDENEDVPTLFELP